MKIFVTGTRGVPDIPGGVEKHCQELYPRIAGKGHQVVIATRSPYISTRCHYWNGIRLVHLYAPAIKSIEAIIHTLLAVIKARQIRSDILHIHAVGPSLMVPFAKFLGLRVVVTNHGPDYDRLKWKLPARLMLKMGEYLGGKFADAVIAISPVIQQIIRDRCNRDAYLILNGVTFPQPNTGTDHLDQFGISPGNYIFTAARFVPEKGIDLLIQAFKSLKLGIKLVIAGDADHETEYSKSLKLTIDDDDTIIRTGYVTGEPLDQLFSHARLFVLPSYHEGLPIALLEALSYGSSVLVSDIPANLAVNLPKSRYFKCGNSQDLVTGLARLIKEPITQAEKNRISRMIRINYDWNKIAEQTIRVYERTLN